MNVLIIGGAGYIGSHTVKYFLWWFVNLSTTL